MTREDLYVKVCERWGMESQTAMLVEECAELIQAVQKFNYRGDCLKDVLEELADVEIMCEQMHVIFQSEAIINHFKKQKLERLEKLVCP